jgi:hypothetical protein
MKKNITIISLILTFIVGCTTDGTKPITETKANFDFNIVTLAPHGLVEFIDKSTNAETLTWDFGDGQTETGKDPIHDYVKEGIYTVTLTASKGSKKHSISKTMEMKGGDYQQVFVKSVSIKKIPNTNNIGNHWDQSNGPDLYIMLQPIGQNYVLNTYNVLFQNVTNFPVKWEIKPNLNVRDLFEDYVLYVYDDDGSTEELISKCTFDFADFNTYPKVAEFSCGGSILEFELEWY